MRWAVFFFVIALVAGCVRPVDRLTADGVCSGLDRDRYAEFCSRWDGAKQAFYDMKWADAVRLGDEARDLRRDGDVERLIKDATAAVRAGDTSPYNMRLEDCPKHVRGQSRNDLFQLLRCDERTRRLPSVDEAEAMLEGMLNRGEHDEITRAQYLMVCEQQLRGRPGDPVRSLRCAWQAERLDPRRLRADVVGLSPSERSQLMKHATTLRSTLLSRAGGNWPEGSREREIFIALPNRFVETMGRKRRNNADTYRAVDAFREKLLAGRTDGCAKPLIARLEQLVSGASSRRKVLQRLAATGGIELAEALAQCHWANRRDARTAAALKLISPLGPPSLAEQVHEHQLSAIRKAKLEIDLPAPRVARPEILEKWRVAAAAALDEVIPVRGVVETVERGADGTKITFAEGGSATVADARAVEAGAWVEVFIGRAGGAITLVRKSKARRSKVARLGDLVLK